jgi:Fe-S oxidoreductase
MNIIDEPRKIIRNIPGVKLIELDAHGKETNCCGGGGGLMVADPNISLQLAKKRLIEAESLGVDALVTACPSCEYMFGKATKYTRSKVKVLDIADLLMQAIVAKG